MRYISDEEMRLWKIVKPWFESDIPEDEWPDEIKKAAEEQRRIAWEDRLKNG